VAPRDVECEGFGITYPRIASDNSKQTGSLVVPDAMENDVDKKVDYSIESFLRKLSQIGPELMSVCGNSLSSYFLSCGLSCLTGRFSLRRRDP
jgi:hypothetical protein